MSKRRQEEEKNKKSYERRTVRGKDGEGEIKKRTEKREKAKLKKQTKKT